MSNSPDAIKVIKTPLTDASAPLQPLTIQLNPNFAFNIPREYSVGQVQAPQSCEQQLVLTTDQLQFLFFEETGATCLLSVPLKEAASIGVTIELVVNAEFEPRAAQYAFSIVSSPQITTSTFESNLEFGTFYTRALHATCTTAIAALLLENLKSFLAMQYTLGWLRTWAQHNGVPFQFGENVATLGNSCSVEWDCPNDSVYITLLDQPDCPIVRVSYSVCKDPSLVDLEQHLKKVAQAFQTQQLLALSC